VPVISFCRSPSSELWSVDQIKAYFPASDGESVLTDRTLYFRDPRGEVYALPLTSITRWRQRRSDHHEHLTPLLQRRILEIEISTFDGGQYLITGRPRRD
jgi:hypothetical protein